MKLELLEICNKNVTAKNFPEYLFMGMTVKTTANKINDQ